MSPALALFIVFLQADPMPEPPPAPASPPQAEPAPSSPPAIEPGPAVEEAQPPAWALGVTAGAAYRLKPASHDVPPALGFAFSTFVGRRYLRLRRLELGGLVTFSYQRFNRTVSLTTETTPGVMVAYDGQRQLSTGDFSLLQTFTVVLGRLRPWVGAGGGISLAHFATQEPKYAPGDSRPTLGQLVAAAGFHLEVSPQTDGGLTVDYGHPFSSTFVTTQGDRLHVFGDRLAVRLEMQYRF